MSYQSVLILQILNAVNVFELELDRKMNQQRIIIIDHDTGTNKDITSNVKTKHMLKYTVTMKLTTFEATVFNETNIFCCKVVVDFFVENIKSAAFICIKHKTIPNADVFKVKMKVEEDNKDFIEDSDVL